MKVEVCRARLPLWGYKVAQSCLYSIYVKSIGCLGVCASVVQEWCWNIWGNSFRRHLKSGKEPGPDRIPNELLEHLPEVVQQEIHKLFILIWMTGTTPKAWSESQKVLLHKKGSEHDLGSWRPITLAKIYTNYGQV